MKIIGITGGSGSGKTTVANRLVEMLDEDAAFITLDSYYKDNTHIPLTDRTKINFDHPDALDYHLMLSHVKELKKGNKIDRPVYSYLTHCRLADTKPVYPKPYLILEGLLLLNHKKLVEECSVIFFLDLDEVERLKRILNRDRTERGRTAEAIKERFKSIVNPMHYRYVESNKHRADDVIHNLDNNITLKRIYSFISNL